MENKTFCQSCSMPLGSDMHGTEKDGSMSLDYCKYCYQRGAFVIPELTLEEMRENIKARMEEQKIDQSIINLAVNRLPELKRWKNLVSQAVPLK